MVSWSPLSLSTLTPLDITVNFDLQTMGCKSRARSLKTNLDTRRGTWPEKWLYFFVFQKAPASNGILRVLLPGKLAANLQFMSPKWEKSCLANSMQITLDTDLGPNSIFPLAPTFFWLTSLWCFLFGTLFENHLHQIKSSACCRNSCIHTCNYLVNRVTNALIW